MNTETPTVGARARVYAALGDPGRLSIVDQLRLQDLSPKELGERLDMAPNLVAHHVKVLRLCGLVAQARSEGDRRRVYLRLTGAVPPDPAATMRLTARRVVFVCTRNSARSQLASALWAQRSKIPGTSAGTDPGPAVHEAAEAAARRHQLVLPQLGTRHISSTARAGDLLVSVCDNAHEQLDVATLLRLHWSVPDPVATGTDDAFDAAIADLSVRTSHLALAMTGESR